MGFFPPHIVYLTTIIIIIRFSINIVVIFQTDLSVSQVGNNSKHAPAGRDKFPCHVDPQNLFLLDVHYMDLISSL